MQELLSYDDVLLKPRYSDIKSRSEVSIAADLDKGVKLEFPVIASPMDTIAEAAMASALGEHGGTAVVHRYNSPEMQARQVSMSRDLSSSRGSTNIIIGAAIGVTGDFLDRAMKVLSAGANFICVDVAHGHHIMMKNALSELRKEFGEDLHIMAGNVATLEGVIWLTGALILLDAISVEVLSVRRGSRLAMACPVCTLSLIAREPIEMLRLLPTEESGTQEILSKR